MSRNHNTQAFTLIELLVVIAIIAILSIVIVLVLNPSQLLMQSRDSNRLADLATINSALGIYSEDQSTATLGLASTTYLSVPDPVATSSQGDQCQGLGLPTLPSGTSYDCANATYYRNIDTTGWIPVPFNSISIKTPFAQLPVDPINQTSSNLYYVYSTNGTQYEVTAALESQKYMKQFLLSTTPDPLRYGIGNNVALASNAEALAGYWNFEEGMGSVVLDASGNGNKGNWNGNATSGIYYATGTVGLYAGTFDGSTDYVSMSSTVAAASNVTVMMWVKPGSLAAMNLYYWGPKVGCNPSSQKFFMNGNKIWLGTGCGSSFSSASTMSLGQWSHAAITIVADRFL
jgi:prepilin-type N-terminal cleavage/methylation domain-containing protein